MNTTLSLVILILCLFLSALFSGFEAGVLAINRARLIHWVQKGSRSARRIRIFFRDMQRLLATILVGNNLVNVAISTITASLGLALFQNTKHAHLYEVCWNGFFAIATIFCCEYLPKLAYRSQPMNYTLHTSALFGWIYRLLTPITSLILLVTRFFMPKKNHTKSSEEFMLTREYIVDTTGTPGEHATVTPLESVMIRRVLELQNSNAQQIMRPINKVVSVTQRASFSLCLTLAAESGHLRIPVFRQGTNHCIGIVNTLAALTANTPLKTPVSKMELIPPCFVHTSVPADNLLPIMRKQKTPMLFVRKKGSEKILGIITERMLLKILTGKRKPIQTQ